MDEDQKKVRESVERMLSFIESHGEIYVGAVDDTVVIRSAMALSLSDAEPFAGDRSADGAPENGS